MSIIPKIDIDLTIVFKSVEDMIDGQIELLKLGSDDKLLVEPQPFNIIDFNISNPGACERLETGSEIENFAA